MKCHKGSTEELQSLKIKKNREHAIFSTASVFLISEVDKAS